MRSFTDNTGTKWQVRYTVADALRVEAAIGIPLYKLVSDVRVAARVPGNGLGLGGCLWPVPVRRSRLANAVRQVVPARPWASK